MTALYISGAVALGLLSIPLMVYILNHLPDRAFCDYGETPTEHHRPPRVTSKQAVAAGLFLAVVFVLLFVRFGFSLHWLLLCLHCIALTMISLSDLRFSIIPDELLIGAGVCAGVYGVIHCVTAPSWSTVTFYLLGALLGAALIFVLNLLGRLIYGQDALGMGDLKLLAVCGLACGPSGILIAALIGIFCAGFFFCGSYRL